MYCRFTPAALLLAALVAGCGKMEEKEPVGTWIGQTATVGGKVGDFRETWTFKDEKVAIDRTGVRPSTATLIYQVDATKEPKQIDIDNARDYPAADNKWLMGIYKIENDTLTICHLIRSKAKVDATRPEEFDTTKRDDVVVVTFRREK